MESSKYTLFFGKIRVAAICMHMSSGKTTLSNDEQFLDVDKLITVAEHKVLSKLRLTAIETNDWDVYNNKYYSIAKSGLMFNLQKLKSNDFINRLVMVHDISMAQGLQLPVMAVCMPTDDAFKHFLNQKGLTNDYNNLAKRNRHELQTVVKVMPDVEIITYEAVSELSAIMLQRWSV